MFKKIFSKKRPELAARERGPELSTNHRGPELSNNHMGPELSNNHMGPELSTNHRVPKHKVFAMIPIFSWRSILILTIGLVIGAGLGLFYHFASQSDNSSDQVWKGGVEVKVVHPESTYMDLSSMQVRTEYYLAKAQSLAFLEFLSQKIVEEIPQYGHTADELAEMINIEHITSNSNPAYNFNITVTTPTVDETAFLITRIPEVFKSYLISEENNKQQQEYQDTLLAIETTKATLLEAQYYLSNISPEGADRDIQNDPSYIALSAEIEALEFELDRHTADLSALIAMGDITEYNNIEQEKYQEILEQAVNISANLDKAEQELQALELEKSDISKDATSIMLNAKISALQAEINKLMTGWMVLTEDGQKMEIGLAELIANGTTSGDTYKDRLDRVEKAITALTEARNELAILENQTVAARLAADLDYQRARAKVVDLNTELSAVKETLTLLAREIIERENQPDVQAAVDRTSAALAEAKKELAIIKTQWSNEQSALDLEYQLTQDKVNNLNEQLTDLNEKRDSLLISDIDTSQLTGSLIVGKPDIPTSPVVPLKLEATVVLGAIIGVVVTWLAMNFRWLIGAVPVSSKEEEEEA
jgi:hypothetical protein